MIVDPFVAPTLHDILAARERIAPYIASTPSIVAGDLAYKLEFFQHTGSFKARGALNTALQFDDGQKRRGIVAVSGGNHGLAAAFVGAALGIPATIVMPVTTPDYVVDAARDYGATIELPPTIADAFARAHELADDGMTLLHPFDDARMMAGAATVALEMLEQLPAMQRAIGSIGGGGLIGGMAIAFKTLRPSMTVIGVETRGADAMHQALRAGHVVTLPAITSIARTLGAPAVSALTLDVVQRFVDRVVVVEDADAVRAIVELQTNLGITVEPAAACTLAALRTGAIDAASDTALVMCGRNVRLEEIAAWRERFATG